MNEKGEFRETALQAQSADAYSISSLVTELSLLVDQLERDCLARHPIDRTTAVEIHQLRTRAEQLLGKLG